MKRFTTFIMSIVLVAGMAAFTGCGPQTEDPGPPPEYVINPGSSGDLSADNGTGTAEQSENDGTAYDSDLLERAVSVRIGRDGKKEWAVNMYNNAAAVTMLGYLSGSPLLFPTYTYDEEEGFVAQSVRGSYTRDDETTITDVKAGELYLFSGGQLRFYFKDVADANVTATPIGYYIDTEGLTDAVTDAYKTNLGDVWGVDVYFQITKTIDETTVD